MVKIGSVTDEILVGGFLFFQLLKKVNSTLSPRPKTRVWEKNFRSKRVYTRKFLTYDICLKFPCVNGIQWLYYIIVCWKGITLCKSDKMQKMFSKCFLLWEKVLFVNLRIEKFWLPPFIFYHHMSVNFSHSSHWMPFYFILRIKASIL